MPKLTVEGYAPVDVADGRRLVLAMEQDAGVDVLHACGGGARCTTCRVEFISGEPEQITEAELERLTQRNLTGVRLCCQIRGDQDMTLRAVRRLEGSGRAGPGSTATDDINPPPIWVDR